MSSSLAIAQRKVIRKKVTECYNLSDCYISLTQAEKLSTKGILLIYQKRLIDLNEQIMNEKFAGTVDEAAIEAELTTCQEYFDKLEHCFP